MKKFALIVGAFVALPLFFFAQGTHALQLAPTIFELAAKPGQSITKSIRLTNETNAPMTLTSQVGIFEGAPEGNGTAKLLPKPKDINSIADWITIDQPRVTLQPGQRMDVPYTINIPATAEPGGQYGWISWNEAPANVDGTGVAISSGIATEILLRVEGDVQEGVTLQSFQSEDGQTSFEKLPVTLVAKIYNGGNVHEKPRGHVQIKNMFGFTVSSLDFNQVDDGGNVLPKEARPYSVKWDKGFAFGKYTATLDATYGENNDKTVSGSFDFWVLPKALLAVWIIIIVIVIALIVMLVMKASKSNMPKAPAPMPAAPKRKK